MEEMGTVVGEAGACNKSHWTLMFAIAASERCSSDKDSLSQRHWLLHAMTEPTSSGALNFDSFPKSTGSITIACGLLQFVIVAGLVEMPRQCSLCA
eukprot:2708797-Amphidinium_carterae.2